jgi:membrane-associated phospholipid phosphatase
MKGLRQLFSAQKWYFISFLMVLILTLVPQLIFTQNELFLEINGLNNSFSDTFFFFLTYFGDGILFVIVILILLFVSYSKSLTGLIVFLSTSILAQGLKNLFFENHFRPVKVLSEKYALHIPDGVTTLLNNSFPSGHTVTAFALATFLVLTFSKRYTWILLLLLAWLTAYSRIYLTHHFPIDVWVGAIIGTFGTLIMYLLFAARLELKYGRKSILRK